MKISIPTATLLVVLHSNVGGDAFSIVKIPTLSAIASQRRYGPVSNRNGLVRCWMSATAENQETESPPSTSLAEAASDKDWWKAHQFSDKALGEESRKDFAILHTELNVNGDTNDSASSSGGGGKPLVYMDSAATSQKPAAVLESVEEYYNKFNSNVHRGAHTLSRRATAMYEEARDVVAQFISAPSRNEVIFTKGATEALNLVAYSYALPNLKPGDEIVLSVMEHHANLVPWQCVAQQTGAVLRFVPVQLHSGDNDDNGEYGGLDMGVLESLLGPQTKIVALQHVSNVMGCVNDVQRIVSLVRSRTSPGSTKIVLDACQSVPHMPVRVDQLGVDFLAASGHKLCGPTGIGFLWGRESLLNEEKMQPFLTGGEMIQDVFQEYSTYAPAPAKFEAGTPPIAQAVGMAAALHYLESWGMERIEAYVHEAAQYLHQRLTEEFVVGDLGDKEADLVIFGPKLGKDRSGVVAFVSPHVHASDLATFLDMEGIAVRAGHHCCQPLHRHLGYSHSVRASLYFYNTKEEIDFFIEKLKETLAFFRGDLSAGSDNDDDKFVPFI